MIDSLSDSEIKLFNAKSKRWKKIRTFSPINQMYLDELTHVIKCLKNKTQSKIINLKNGVDTFLISETIKKAQRNCKAINLRR